MVNSDEVFLEINNYPNYLISNKGNVYSKHTKKNLVPKTSTGYCRVELRNDEGNKTFLIHKLVASHFIGVPSDPSLQVHHIDGDRKNNSVDNLAYVTASDNVKAFHKKFKENQSRISNMSITPA